MEKISNFSRKWEVLKVLVKMDFSARYQSSFLGFMWVLLKPLLLFVVLVTVFTFFGADILHFQVYLLLGIVLYQFFADGTNFGMQSIINKSNILLKVRVDKELVVLGSVINAAIFSGFSFLLFGGFLGYYDIAPSLLNIVQFLIIFLSLFCFVLGIAFMLSVLMVRFRDIAAIWEVFLMALFYLVPIFYSFSIVPEDIRSVLLLNPLAWEIILAREVLVYGHFVPWERLGILLLGTLIFLGLGYLFFRQFSRSIMEKI